MIAGIRAEPDEVMLNNEISRIWWLIRHKILEDARAKVTEKTCLALRLLYALFVVL